MSDYIDRKILLFKLSELGGCDAEPDTWADGYDKAIDLVYGLVRGMPAADVETVVRCRDCKCFSRDKEYNRAWCNYSTGSAETAVNGFCFRIPRKTLNCCLAVRGARKDGGAENG